MVQGLPSMRIWSLLIFRSHVQRSRSNHSPQPNVLSDQYLLTPLLDQYQTWFRGCYQWVDEPYWFWRTCSKVKVKPLFSDHSVVRSIFFFNPFTWSIPNLVQGLCLISRWSLLIFRSHVQRSEFKSQMRVITHNFEPCDA